MAQADSKLIVLGALAGMAGVSLAAVWYHSLKSRRQNSWSSSYLSNPDDSMAGGGGGGGLTVVDGPAGLAPGGQAEVLDRLEALIRCVSELKDEMKALKSALPLLPDQVRQELKGRGRAEGGAAGSRRTTPTRRKRAAATGSAARSGGQSSEEAESEGGYMTALTDSDEEEPSRRPRRRQEEEEEKEEEGKEKEGKEEEEEEEEEMKEPVDQLIVFLERIDSLHRGDSGGKRQSFDTLLQFREEYGHSSSFLWRLARAYCDAHDLADTLEEKKTLAASGNQSHSSAR